MYVHTILYLDTYMHIYINSLIMIVMTKFHNYAICMYVQYVLGSISSVYTNMYVCIEVCMYVRIGTIRDYFRYRAGS